MAKKLFESYSKGLMKDAGKTTDVVILDSEETTDRLQLYRENKKNKGIIELLFSYVSEEGNLIAKDEHGVQIVLLKDVLIKDMPYYDKSVGEKLVATAFTVSITKIDEKTGTVYVKSARPGEQAKKATIRSRLVGELFNELNKGHTPRIAGVIRQVTGTKAYVDILGKGILGFVYSKDWGKAHYRFFKEQCKEGEVYEFDIVRSLPPNKNHKIPAFILSRKEVADDPWDAIPDEFLKQDAVITVRCVERPQKKTYWWGVSELLPAGIEIQADYTKKCADIMVGAVYKCKVRMAERKAHVFRVVPFGIADSEVGTEKAIRFLDPKHKVK